MKLLFAPFDHDLHCPPFLKMQPLNLHFFFLLDPFLHNFGPRGAEECYVHVLHRDEGF
jgi:hypothetical protein